MNTNFNYNKAIYTTVNLRKFRTSFHPRLDDLVY